MLQADAFEPDQWRDQLQGAVGVVSCLGGFGSNDFMLKVCCFRPRPHCLSVCTLAGPAALLNHFYHVSHGKLVTNNDDHTNHCGVSCIILQCTAGKGALACLQLYQ